MPWFSCECQASVASSFGFIKASVELEFLSRRANEALKEIVEAREWAPLFEPHDYGVQEVTSQL